MSRRNGLEIKAAWAPPRHNSPPPTRRVSGAGSAAAVTHAIRKGLKLGGYNSNWNADCFRIANSTSLFAQVGIQVFPTPLQPRSTSFVRSEMVSIHNATRERDAQAAGPHRMSESTASLGQLNLHASARDEAHLARARSAIDARAERLQATADRSGESNSLWNRVTSFFRSLFS